MAVRDGDFEPGPDQLVERDFVVAVSERWRGWRTAGSESERELVSGWESVAVVLDSAASGKPDAAERERGSGYGVVRWAAVCVDELGGDQDQRDGECGWEPY